jgi:hypothetical protein
MSDYKSVCGRALAPASDPAMVAIHAAPTEYRFHIPMETLFDNLPGPSVCRLCVRVLNLKQKGTK